MEKSKGGRALCAPSKSVLDYVYLVIWFCADDMDIVNIMLHAQKLGMARGDFVFFFFTRMPLDEGVNLRVWDKGAPEGMSASEWANRRLAFYPLKMVSYKTAFKEIFLSYFKYRWKKRWRCFQTRYYVIMRMLKCLKPEEKINWYIAILDGVCIHDEFVLYIAW